MLKERPVLEERSLLPQIGQWSSLEELVSLQDKQLPMLLSWAAGSKFYQERFNSRSMPRSRADFGGLPLTTKQDLRGSYPFGMLAVSREELATYHESSGTAGDPTPSYYTAEDWTDLAERYARKWVGISAADTFLVRTPYALMITGHLAQAAGRLHGATVVPGDNRSLAMPYARVIRVLHDLDVTITWSMPTETLLWAAAARELRYRPDTDFPALRALFVGGEPLTVRRRERISRIWGVPVVEEFGSTETGSLAGACPHGRMHLWADRAIFEVYDPASGRMSTEGSGELVVTPLFRRAMPLIRYHLADNVVISYADCGCGWLLPTVQVLGRAAFGYQVQHTAVSQYQVEELVFSLPLSHGVLFWRGRAEQDGLHLEIEVADSHAGAARAALAALVQQELGVSCTIDTLPLGTLVPPGALTATRDVAKPRSLFGPGESWDKALLYY